MYSPAAYPALDITNSLYPLYCCVIRLTRQKDTKVRMLCIRLTRENRHGIANSLHQPPPPPFVMSPFVVTKVIRWDSEYPEGKGRKQTLIKDTFVTTTKQRYICPESHDVFHSALLSLPRDYVDCYETTPPTMATPNHKQSAPAENTLGSIALWSGTSSGRVQLPQGDVIHHLLDLFDVVF